MYGQQSIKKKKKKKNIYIYISKKVLCMFSGGVRFSFWWGFVLRCECGGTGQTDRNRTTLKSSAPPMSLGTPKISLVLDHDRTWLSVVRGRQVGPMAWFKAILGLYIPYLLPQTHQTTTPPPKLGILLRNLAKMFGSHECWQRWESIAVGFIDVWIFFLKFSPLISWRN